MKTQMAALLLAAALLLCTGALAENDPFVCGSWSEPAGHVYTFCVDGTYLYTLRSGTEVRRGLWFTQDGVLTVLQQNRVLTAPYSVTEEGLQLTYTGGSLAGIQITMPRCDPIQPFLEDDAMPMSEAEALTETETALIGDWTVDPVLIKYLYLGRYGLDDDRLPDLILDALTFDEAFCSLGQDRSIWCRLHYADGSFTMLYLSGDGYRWYAHDGEFLLQDRSGTVTWQVPFSSNGDTVLINLVPNDLSGTSVMTTMSRAPAVQHDPLLIGTWYERQYASTSYIIEFREDGSFVWKDALDPGNEDNGLWYTEDNFVYLGDCLSFRMRYVFDDDGMILYIGDSPAVPLSRDPLPDNGFPD